MIVLNETHIGKVDYSGVKELSKMITIQEYGLTSEFYGGAVQYLGYIKGSDVIQLLNNESGEFVVLSIAVEDWSGLNFFQLKQIAVQKGMKLEESVKKEEVMEMLLGSGSIIIVEKGDPVKENTTINLKD